MTCNFKERSYAKEEWEVYYDNSYLGCVQWYEPWKKYVFIPCGSTPLRSSWLDHILQFIRNRTNDR